MSAPSPLPFSLEEINSSIPAAQLLGIRVTAVSAGSSTVEMEILPQHHNPFQTAHGGILTTLSDTAMGVAFMTTLAEGQYFATLELKTNFLRGAFSGRHRAVARVVHRGRTTGLVECDILNEQDQLVNRATSTCLVLQKPV